MNLSPSKTHTILAGCLAAAALFAPVAEAKTAAPKVAKFAVKIKGEQTLSWNYNRPQSDPCSGSERAGGSTRITYSTKAGTLTAFTPPKSNPAYALTKGRPLLTGSKIEPGVTLRREGEHSVVDAPPSCPALSDGEGTRPAIKCGTLGAVYRTTFAYKGKNRLSFAANADRGWSGFAGSGLSLNTAFENCPSWLTGPAVPSEMNGEVEPGTAALKESKLYDKKAKTLVAKGLRTRCFREGGPVKCGAEGGSMFTGKVIDIWTITLKRR